MAVRYVGIGDYDYRCDPLLYLAGTIQNSVEVVEIQGGVNEYYGHRPCLNGRTERGRGPLDGCARPSGWSNSS